MTPRPTVPAWRESQLCEIPRDRPRAHVVRHDAPRISHPPARTEDDEKQAPPPVHSDSAYSEPITAIAYLSALCLAFVVVFPIAIPVVTVIVLLTYLGG